MIRAAEHRALPSLRVHAQLDIHAVAVEHAEAVPDPVVPAVLRREEAHARRAHEAAPHRQAVADLAVESAPLREAAARHPGHVSRPHSASAPLVACRCGSARYLAAWPDIVCSDVAASIRVPVFTRLACLSRR